MKKLLKKSISVLLAAVLLLTVIPFAAGAEESDPENTFSVITTSNVFPEKKVIYSDLSKFEDENGDVFVTVDYKLKAYHQYLVNLDIDELTWDPAVLEFKEAYNTYGSRFTIFPFAYELGLSTGKFDTYVVNTFGDNNGGRILGNYTSVNPVARAYEKDGSPITLVRAKFKVLDREAAATTVNLKMDTVSFCDDSCTSPYVQYQPVSGGFINEEAYALGAYSTAIIPGVNKCQHEHVLTVEATPASYTQEGLTDGVRCKHCGEWLIEQQIVPKKEIDFVIGDLDGDGVLAIQDATGLQRFLADYVDLDLNDEKTFLQADMNGDGKVNVRDVTAVMRSLVNE